MERVRMWILCCPEHVEMALDDAVDHQQVAPHIDDVHHVAQLSEMPEIAKRVCRYCGRVATYVVWAPPDGEDTKPEPETEKR